MGGAARGRGVVGADIKDVVPCPHVCVGIVFRGDVWMRALIYRMSRAQFVPLNGNWQRVQRWSSLQEQIEAHDLCQMHVVPLSHWLLSASINFKYKGFPYFSLVCIPSESKYQCWPSRNWPVVAEPLHEIKTCIRGKVIPVGPHAFHRIAPSNYFSDRNWSTKSRTFHLHRCETVLSCALVHSAKAILGNSHISSGYFVVSLIYLRLHVLDANGEELSVTTHSQWTDARLTVAGHHRLQGGQHTSKITIGYCTYIDSSRSMLPQTRPCQLTSSKVTLAVVRLSVWGKPKVSRVFKQRIQTEHLDYANVPHGRVRNVDRRF